MTRRIAAVIVAVLATACSSQPQSNRFASDGILSREAIELHANGTFVYCARSDDGPTEFSAEGTWRWLDRAHRQLETVTVGRHVARGNVSPSDDLPDVVVRTVGRDTLQRESRAALRRVTAPYLTRGGCTLSAMR